MWSSCSPCLTASVDWWRRRFRTTLDFWQPETKWVQLLLMFPQEQQQHDLINYVVTELLNWLQTCSLCRHIKLSSMTPRYLNSSFPWNRRGKRRSLCEFYLKDSKMVTFTSLYCVHRVGLKTQPESKCPELLANYCDMLLRKTPLSKKLTSEEIEAKLKEVVCCVKQFLRVVVISRDFSLKTWGISPWPVLCTNTWNVHGSVLNISNFKSRITWSGQMLINFWYLLFNHQ